MAITIVHGWSVNEGPDGTMQGSPTFAARPETPSEELQTARAALLACTKVGIVPTPCRVIFYGHDFAVVTFKDGAMRNESVTVRM